MPRPIVASLVLPASLVLGVLASSGSASAQQSGTPAGAQAWQHLQAAFRSMPATTVATPPSVEVRDIDGCRARMVLSEPAPRDGMLSADLDLGRLSAPTVSPAFKIGETIIYVVNIPSASGEKDIRTVEGKRDGPTDGEPVWQDRMVIGVASKAWGDSAAAILAGGIQACRGTS